MDHQKLLTNLPSEIIITILCRLPPKTIISCKCVCKLLFNLLETPDFVKFHLSKSIPGLIVYNETMLPHSFEIVEFKDELGLHYFPVAEFGCRAFVDLRLSDIIIQGSANGLLFLSSQHTTPSALYICNPITREYINLPNHGLILHYPGAVKYGFGVSKKTGQYKVVKIFQEFEIDEETNSLLSILKSECRVYTLGTGTWRSIPYNCSLRYIDPRSKGVFLNGNLHWLVSELEESLLILCFDLEMELFKVLSPPPPCLQGRLTFGVLEVPGDCLYLCDKTLDDEIAIWVMKEYGVQKSWTKEVVINKLPDPFGKVPYVYPIKVFGDGDILMLLVRYNLAYYSNKTKTTSSVELFKQQMYNHIETTRLHVFSFLSLKSFAKENESKF